MRKGELLERIKRLEAKVFPKLPEVNEISTDGNWRWDGKDWRTIYVSWHGKFLKTKEDWDTAYADPYFPFPKDSAHD